MFMKTISKTTICVLYLIFCIAPILHTAWAHRVNVFAWVQGDTVHVQSKFAGGKTVKAGKIVVMDSHGKVLLSGLTNDQGEFSFKFPTRTDLKIALIAGQGHQAQWIIPAAEIEGISSEVDAPAGAEASKRPQKETGVSEPIAGIEPQTSTPENNLQELESVIESVLDRKLKPITRLLADTQQKGPTVGDIFAGLGYIMGLVGIAAYVHSRKKKA
jgi:nickel transport protein